MLICSLMPDKNEHLINLILLRTRGGIALYFIRAKQNYFQNSGASYYHIF